MKYLNEEEYYEENKPQQKPSWRAQEQEVGCTFCFDNRTKKNIDIYFFDRANNMRISSFCPNCGRKF